MNQSFPGTAAPNFYIGSQEHHAASSVPQKAQQQQQQQRQNYGARDIPPNVPLQAHVETSQYNRTPYGGAASRGGCSQGVRNPSSGATA